jgi:hypothetical protein
VTIAWVLGGGGLSPARAQPLFNGLLTGHIGAAHGGDVRGATAAPGLSLAVIDQSGLGAELDLWHVLSLDGAEQDRSSATALMLGFTAVFAHHERIRPFLVVNAGVLRVRALLDGDSRATRTDPAIGGGAGVSYVLNELFQIRGDIRYVRHLQRQAALAPIAKGHFDLWRTSVGLTYVWPVP